MCIVTLAFVAPAAVCQTAWAQPSSLRTVVAVHWSTEDFPGSAVMDAAIRAAITASSDSPVDYNAEYLETDRFPAEQASLALRDDIRLKYQGRRIDLVIAVAEPALQFALRFRSELFPAAPIVVSGLSARFDSLRTDGNGLTGLVSLPGYAATAELALKLHPSAKEMFVIAEAPTYELENLVQADLSPIAQRVRLTIIREATVAGLVAAVREVPSDSVILFIRYSREDPGHVLTPPQVAALVAQASPAPVYGIVEGYIGSGVVGGVVSSSEAIGTRIGEMAKQILDGTPALDIPIGRASIVPMFDWRQLRRWGIAESSLPSDSIVRFREFSIWERYRGAIVATLAVLLVQSVLIGALLVERRTRRRSQMALRESEERTEIAGVSLGVGFWTWESDADRVWTTRQCAWLLGSESGKPLTLGAFLDALRPQIGEPAQDAFERAVRSRTPFNGEWPVAQGDGLVRWIAAAARPSVDASGRPRVTGTLVDVTPRKTAELLAAEQRRELAHLNRVAMLGEMSGVLAHELKQPLTAIRSYAQGSLRLIGKDEFELAAVRQSLEAIVRAEHHADEVIDRARALLKRNVHQATEVDLNDVVRETLELASVELDTRPVIAVTQLAEDLPPVVGDRIELEQVVMNLLLNACDAMVGIAPVHRRLTLTTSYDGERVRLFVSDTGTGIPADSIDRVFEPFVTTKRDGLGLGLAICRSIVGAQGGAIRASNNPEGGSTFQISLPRAVRSPVPAMDAPMSPPAGSLRIVVVDDNESVRRALQRLLVVSGHQVRVFASAEDLLAEDVVADFFLFDVRLPRMSGVELARRIRASGSSVPIVMMTGKDQEPAIVQSGLPSVRKPFDEAVILSAIARETGRAA